MTLPTRSDLALLGRWLRARVRIQRVGALSVRLDVQLTGAGGPQTQTLKLRRAS